MKSYVLSSTEQNDVPTCVKLRFVLPKGGAVSCSTHYRIKPVLSGKPEQILRHHAAEVDESSMPGVG